MMNMPGTEAVTEVRIHTEIPETEVVTEVRIHTENLVTETVTEVKIHTENLETEAVTEVKMHTENAENNITDKSRGFHISPGLKITFMVVWVLSEQVIMITISGLVNLN